MHSPRLHSLVLRLPVQTVNMTPYTWADKFESFERINSIRETNRNFDSCNSSKRLVPSRSHELHESKFPFVSRMEFIRSKLSNFSAHVYGSMRCLRCSPATPFAPTLSPPLPSARLESQRCGLNRIISAWGSQILTRRVFGCVWTVSAEHVRNACVPLLFTIINRNTAEIA